MDAAFSFATYVIKQQGLAIAGKYVVHTPQDAPVLWVKYKTSWRAPHVRHLIFSDSKRSVEALTVMEAEHPEFDDFYEVTDKGEGVMVGGFAADWDSFLTDAWAITDARGDVIATVREGTTRGIAHELTGGAVSQNLTIRAGDQPLAELRQKGKWKGHDLHIDFTPDVGGALDRRLGLAVAIAIAAHQGATENA